VRRALRRRLLAALAWLRRCRRAWRVGWRAAVAEFYSPEEHERVAYYTRIDWHRR
jgi:hypothetical protein